MTYLRNQLLLLFLLHLILLCALLWIEQSHSAANLSSKEQLIQTELNLRLAGISNLSTAQLSALEKELKLKELSFTPRGSATSLTIIRSAQTDSLAALLLPRFERMQQLTTTDGVVSFRMDNRAEHRALTSSLQYIALCIAISALLLSALLTLLFFRFCRDLGREILLPLSVRGLPKAVTGLLHKTVSQFRQQLNQQQLTIRTLQKALEIDPLSGLCNSNAFEQKLDQLVSNEAHAPHSLLFIHLTQLETINQQQGQQGGDQFIKEITGLIQFACKKTFSLNLYRLRGGEFAILAEQLAMNDLHTLCQTIENQFAQYQETHSLEPIGYTGATQFKSGEQPEAILTRASIALTKAQTENTCCWAIVQKGTEQRDHSEQHWKRVIDELLERQEVEFYEQPVHAINPRMVNYRKLYSRFYNKEGAALPSDIIFAMAQKLGLSEELEMMIFTTLFKQLSNDNSGHYWGVAVSSSAITQKSFIHWLDNLLRSNPIVTQKLIFELSEGVLERSPESAKLLFTTLKKQHCRTCISHFGHGASSLKLFHELHPDMVKLDGVLVNDVHHNGATQQFVRMLIELTHQMGCHIIAEGIEHYEQRDMLESMHLDAVQGYFIAKPRALAI